MQVRIVLVEPQEGGNVGAAARAMKNFGLTDLVVAGRTRQEIDEHSRWWAAGADDLLQAVRYVPTLEEALVDCQVSVATTAIRGRQVMEQLTPVDVASIASELDDQQRIALVFGRETSGLTFHETTLCQRTASIPASPEYPVMNLAQSVAIFCYEMRRRALHSPPAPRDLAEGELLQALNRHTRRLLGRIAFFAEKRPERVCAELQALAGRAMLTTREASLLLAFVRHLEKELERAESVPE